MFESGCTLAAATAVCGEAEPEAQVLEGLAALVDNSLLRVETRPAAEQRFRILETIREFALERLTSDADDLQATRRRHDLYFLSLAEAASDDCTAEPESNELAAESDNVRATLRWSVDTGETELGLRLASRLSPLWRVNGTVREGRLWLAALFAARETARTGPCGQALCLAGSLAERDGDYETAEAHFREALQLARAIGDADVACRALDRLGVLSSLRDDLETAADLFSETVETARASSWPWIGWPLLHTALTSVRLGRISHA